jgi:hypothetical protein
LKIIYSVFGIKNYEYKKKIELKGLEILRELNGFSEDKY